MAAVSFFDSPGTNRVRFLLACEDSYRLLAWMQIRADGSLVFGPGTPKGGPGFAKMGTARPNAGHEARVEYADGKPIHDKRERRELHLTYHASGIVNAGSRRSYSSPLRGLRRPFQLFQIVFRHPTSMPDVQSPRNWDTVLITVRGVPFEVAGDRPLVGRVVAGPPGKVPVEINDSRNVVSLVMLYPGSDHCEPLDFNFEFATGPTGPWAPYSYVTWRAEPAR